MLTWSYHLNPCWPSPDSNIGEELQCGVSLPPVVHLADPGGEVS